MVMPHTGHFPGLSEVAHPIGQTYTSLGCVVGCVLAIATLHPFALPSQQPQGPSAQATAPRLTTVSATAHTNFARIIFSLC
jgi:hypothetical protein